MADTLGGVADQASSTVAVATGGQTPGVQGQASDKKVLSVQDLFLLVNQMGIPADQQATAIAIALAESNGEVKAYNGVGKDNSWGPWQINTKGAGQQYLSNLGVTTPSELWDPVKNAYAMKVLSKGGTNWNAWTTFTSGKYKQFLPGVEEQIKGVKYDAASNTSVSDPNRAGAAQEGFGPAPTWQDFLGGLGSGSTWLRVAKVVGGMVLVGGALFILANRNGAVTDTVQAAAKVA